MKRMKMTLWVLGLLFGILPLSALAQAHDFGLGVIIGEPTGVSWKVWTGSSRAIAGAAAWSFGKTDALHLHADYLFHSDRVFRVSRGRMPFYYGLGVRLLFHDKPERSTSIGARFPLGAEYLFARAPLGLFLEIVPVLDLSPATDFDVDAAIGIRFYF